MSELPTMTLFALIPTIAPQLRIRSSEQPRNEAANFAFMARTKERNDVGRAWGGGWRGSQRHGRASKVRHGGWALPHAITTGNALKNHSIRAEGTTRLFYARDPN